MLKRRRENPEKKTARRWKAAGISKHEYVHQRTRQLDDAARENGWKASETAATIADMIMIADEVWTDVVVRFKKVRGELVYRASRDGVSFRAVPCRFGVRILRDGQVATIVDDREHADLWLNSDKALTAVL